MNNIYITGFMCSGKTSVSKALSKLKDMALYDTDKIIENKLNMKITDIFEKFGEDYFRQIETEVLKEVSKFENSIISTGGGIVLREENRLIMKNTGIIISLMPDFSVIEARLENSRSTRPLLMDETDKIRKRFYDRQPLYKDCNFEVIPDINSTPENISEEIAELLGR